MREDALCATWYSDGFMISEHVFITPGTSMANVYISYSYIETQDFARELQEALARRGYRVFVEKADIAVGMDWVDHTSASIEDADVFVFVISPDSVESVSPCREELAHAVVQNKRLIPILRRDVDPEAVPEPLSRYIWIYFREDDDFDQALQSLVEAINRNSD